MLQVAPADSPGFVRRLFGARCSASSSDVQALASAIHDILSHESRIRDLLWQTDGPPDEAHSANEPIEENSQQRDRG